MSRHPSLHARLPLLLVIVAIGFLAACGQAPPSTPSGAGDGSSSPSAAAPAPPVCSSATNSAADRPWWADRVFYEVFVRSFQDSDGDGIGDLRGLISRLDELNDGDAATTDDLGVTGLWLMPVAQSPSYHGYDVVDYRTVETDYGTNDDFKALVAEAHARGIAIVVDFVINHTSRDHPWFQDALTPGSEHDDWYLWSDTRPAVAKSDGSRVWHEAGDRFYYGYFSDAMPDLNLENPDVVAEIDATARFWLDEMGVDGFRLDAARHLIEDGKQLENTPETLAWLADFRTRLHTDHPDALVLGEVFDATSMSSRYVRDGSLDLAFDFGLAGATLLAIGSGDAGSVEAALGEVAGSYPPGGAATFLTNHDQDRVADELSGDAAAEKLAATLLLTGPGTPFIYYGEEIGLSGHKPDEQIRRPMRWEPTSPSAGFSTGTPWEPLGDDPPGIDVATQSADPGSLLSTYRDLIRLRASHPALATGETIPVDADDPHVAAFLRSDGNESALVVANLDDAPVSGPSLSLDAGPLCGTPAATSLLGEADPTRPAVTASGGFDEYVPVDGLGPRETVVIGLAR